MQNSDKKKINKRALCSKQQEKVKIVDKRIVLYFYFFTLKKDQKAKVVSVFFLQLFPLQTAISHTQKPSTLIQKSLCYIL